MNAESQTWSRGNVVGQMINAGRARAGGMPSARAITSLIDSMFDDMMAFLLDSIVELKAKESNALPRLIEK